MGGRTKGVYNRHILPRSDPHFCQGLTLISGACEDAKKAALFPANFAANFAAQNEAGRAAGQLV